MANIPPTTYISIRITVPHAMADSVIAVIAKEEWYIMYPHTGSVTEKEHFHVFVPGCGKSDCERYRLAFKRSAGFTVYGNRTISVKSQDNGLCRAISYGAKEKTEPYVKGDFVSEWINASPAWVQKVGKRKRNADGVITLTCINHVQLAFEYRKANNLHSDDLCEVVRRMICSGEYMVDANFMRSGAPDFLIDVFKEACENGELKWKPLCCRLGLWKPPRQTW